MPPRDQTLMGFAIAIACLVGLRHARRLLTGTKKGARLIGWFGEPRALWVVRGLLALGILFGILLARGIVNPIRW